MIKAIETSYKGYRFRSRLEARWAVFFETLGVKWEYEPEGFELPSGRYLPDFRVRYPDASTPIYWFEVKGDAKDVTDRDRARYAEFTPGVTLLDGPPAMRMYYGGGFTGEIDNDILGIALWSHKRRPWQDHPSNFFIPLTDTGYGQDWLKCAVDAARAARFEFGECGAPA